ncbi:carbon storage regulator [Pseudomonas chlororaphis subsp. aurantiaca]|uniref:carbon storage regulator n=1 Tax=Pseudomonas chlororaphis TaxID=587753 RepID=UPI00398AD7B2
MKMLLLSCRPGETFKLGEEIVVSVMDIQGKHVRLGLIAPKKIAIHRHEHYQKYQGRKR